MPMINLLNQGLSHRSGLVRKGAAALLLVPKWYRSLSTDPGDLASRPPVLANSFPKSGTHLLVQILGGLPDRVNYGEFLASTTSSFRFRERSAESTCRFIRGFVPGEIIRGHLYFEPLYADELAKRHTVNYFIYRDLRDVVVSEAHYLRDMNRWHRLHPYFRRLKSIEDAITLSITGLNPPTPGIEYPNIAERFARYQGWLTHPDCFCLRFEDLRSEKRATILRQMAEFYLHRDSRSGLDVNESVRAMEANVEPHKSHTFRSGQKAAWQKEFTAEHRRLFNEIAGGLVE
jgi:hypothetical protein